MVKRLKTAFLSAVFLALAINFALLPSVQAQNDTVPEKVVILKITLPDGMWVKGSVIEGGVFSIKDDNSGYVFGFAPAVRNIATGEVTVKVFRASKIEGNKALEEVGSFEASFDSPQCTTANPAFKFEIVAIVQQVPSAKSAGV
jgi:hypothetical protein